jgi:hypothetical protein
VLSQIQRWHHALPAGFSPRSRTYTDDADG